MANAVSTAYDLLAPANIGDPYPLYAELQALGPVHWSASLGGWAITRHREVVAGLRDPGFSASRFSPYLERLGEDGEVEPEAAELYRRLGEWFTFADAPGHTRLRTLTRRVFSGPMKATGPRVERLVDELLERALQGEVVDVVNDLARPLSVLTIVDLLGVPHADADRFTEWSDSLTEYIGGALDVPDRRDRATGAIAELGDYLRATIEERRDGDAPGLISALLTTEYKGDRLTDEEIVATSAMMLFAGHGTTTNLIGNGMYALLRNPTQLEALAGGLESPERVVEELLRYDSPVHITTRVATTADPLRIGEIAPGDRVFLFLAAANRDPDEYERPHELDVSRTEKQHVSFGFGVHFCLGAPLARIEAPAMFRALVDRVRSFELTDAPLAWQQTVGFRGLKSLPVRMRPR